MLDFEVDLKYNKSMDQQRFYPANLYPSLTQASGITLPFPPLNVLTFTPFMRKELARFCRADRLSVQ